MSQKINLVYIIDDDAIFVKLTAHLLKTNRVCDQFMIFKNGKDALEYIKPKLLNFEPLADLILLDINMPIMDGWEFLDILKTIPKSENLNINLVSSSIDPLDIQKAKTYDLIKNFISKPISVEKLNL